MAENKAIETMTAMDSLKAELRQEKENSRSAMNMVKRVSKESAAIKRALQSLGCKVQFTTGGDCTVDIESNPASAPQKLPYPVSESESESSPLRHGEKSDFSVSVMVMDDVPSNPIGRVCEALCPLRSRYGHCKWPDAGCAQLSSQFVGLKANFDAFDQLSIYDSYFKPE